MKKKRGEARARAFSKCFKLEFLKTRPPRFFFVRLNSRFFHKTRVFPLKLEFFEKLEFDKPESQTRVFVINIYLTFDVFRQNCNLVRNRRVHGFNAEDKKNKKKKSLNI